jgi:hypothetical protein
MVIAPFVEFVTISGLDELLYACCKLVSDTPPAEPMLSPNLDTSKNCACVLSDKLVAPCTTDKTPMSTALSLNFGNIVNISFATLDIAYAKAVWLSGGLLYSV